MNKNYVTYESERNNPFINQFTKLSSEVQRLIVQKDETILIEPFVNLGNYKNVRSLAELDNCLPNNETLVIEISEKNLDKVNKDNIFAYRPVNKEVKSTKYEIGKKAYLLPYDYALGGLPHEVKNALEPSVLLKKPASDAEESVYVFQPIITITDSIRQRRDYLAEAYGEYSDLYYEVKDSKVVEMFEVDIMELTKVGPQSWIITKTPEYLQSSPSK